MSSYIYRGIPLPPETKEAIDLYVEHGLPPGDFLEACLSNDLCRSFGLADEKNRAAMPAIVGYLYDRVPTVCWGSREKIAAWCERRYQERAMTACGRNR